MSVATKLHTQFLQNLRHSISLISAQPYQKVHKLITFSGATAAEKDEFENKQHGCNQCAYVHLLICISTLNSAQAYF